MNTFVHGVGSSCGGEQYHHEVYHLVESGGVTLCGTPVRGKDWWIDNSVPRHFFILGSEAQILYPGDQTICQRCAKIRIKRGL